MNETIWLFLPLGLIAIGFIASCTLTITFIIMKLRGTINWKWYSLLVPLYFAVGFVFIYKNLDCVLKALDRLGLH